MSFEVELTNNQTGEDKALFIEGKDMDAAINLVHEEYPEFTLSFIGKVV